MLPFIVNKDEYRNLSSNIDLQANAGSAFDNSVTLTWTLTCDLLTSGSIHADVVQWVCTKFGPNSLSRFPFRARRFTHRRH